MTAPLSCQVMDDGIAVVTFEAPPDGPPTLGADTLAAAAEIFDDLHRRNDIRAVVVASAGGDTFLAGADLRQLRALCAGPEPAAAVSALAAQGQAVLATLERLAPPTVAVIDGACLGGGLEVALACRYRLAVDRPAVRLGLPEVRLGLVPGLGGTQRLPRVVGLRTALTWMLEGRLVNARQARRAGLVDRLIPPEAPLAAARGLAERCARGHPPKRRRRPRRERWLEATALTRAIVFGAAGRAIAARGGHYPAPTAIRLAVQAGFDRPGPSGYAAEAAAIGRCAATPVARHLIDLFLDARAAGRGVPAAPAPPAEGRGVVVLGAGVMGAGIAHWAAARGCRVLLRDLTNADCARGLQVVAGIVRRATRAGHLTDTDGEALLRRITPRTDLTGADGADVVLEAVLEDLDVKRAALAEVEARVGPATLLATNTSTIPVGELAGALRRPERLCGIHFFNPVRRMELVEVIAGAATAATTLASAVAFVKQRLGRTPVIVADRPGFFVNRCLGPYLAEAAACCEAGAAPDAVDAALERFGMAMGPFAVLATVGLGTARRAARVLRAAFGARHAPTRLLDFVEADRPLDAAHWRRAATRAAEAGGVAARPHVGPAEIVERCVLMLVNEVAWALSEGVVADAATADLAMVLGTGFAPWSGGPGRWADAEGPARIVERLRQCATLHGDRFTPAPWLVARAADGHGFYA